VNVLELLFTVSMFLFVSNRDESLQFLFRGLQLEIEIAIFVL